MGRRIEFIDEYRGLAVVLMVFYHFLFDLYATFNIPLKLFDGNYRYYLVYFISGSFILISGIVSNFSKSNLKRGTFCFAFAMILTIATYIVMPQFVILFGILHFLSIAMISAHLIKPLTQKIKPILGIIINLILFAVTIPISKGYIGFKNLLMFNLPSSLYSTNLLFPFGIYSSSFYSGDYYPLFPWIFLFFTGLFIGKILSVITLPPFFYKTHSKVLSFIGKKSFVIYILHQPIILAVLFLYFNIIK